MRTILAVGRVRLSADLHEPVGKVGGHVVGGVEVGAAHNPFERCDGRGVGPRLDRFELVDHTVVKVFGAQNAVVLRDQVLHLRAHLQSTRKFRPRTLAGVLRDEGLRCKSVSQPCTTPLLCSRCRTAHSCPERIETRTNALVKQTF